MIGKTVLSLVHLCAYAFLAAVSVPTALAESGESAAEPRVLEHATLVFDEAEERTLEPGTIHSWKVPAQAGQFLEIEVEPEEFDAILRLLDPEGQLDAELNLSSKGQSEKASWITTAPESWTLQVLSRKKDQAGPYVIRWKTARVANESDPGTVEGQRLYHQARTFHMDDDYAAAEAPYRRALALREASLGPNHPDLAQTVLSLAILLRTLARYDEAEPLFRRSLEIEKKTLGPDYDGLASDLNSLAILYDHQGRYDEAEPLYKRSGEIWKEALGPAHSAVAGVMNNLANLYKNQGRYDEAEPLYERSRTIWERELGPHHYYLADSLNNLALVYFSQGRYDEAETLHQRALAIRESAFGPEHPLVAASLTNLADLYGFQGRFREAEPLYLRTLEIKQKSLGENHPDVARSLNGLAELYLTPGKVC